MILSSANKDTYCFYAYSPQIIIFLGLYPIKPPLPAVGGGEGVGEVTEVGPKVTSLRKGDVVIPASPELGKV